MLLPAPMNSDTFIVPTGQIQDIPSFLILQLSITHLEEMEKRTWREKKEKEKSGWQGKTMQHTHVLMLSIFNSLGLCYFQLTYWMEYDSLRCLHSLLQEQVSSAKDTSPNQINNPGTGLNAPHLQNFIGMNDPAICDVDDDHGIVKPDELRNGRLPFLSKRNNNHKFVNDCRGEKVVRMGEKRLYTG
jgi:hypothetical protein